MRNNIRYNKIYNLNPVIKVTTNNCQVKWYANELLPITTFFEDKKSYLWKKVFRPSKVKMTHTIRAPPI